MQNAMNEKKSDQWTGSVADLKNMSTEEIKRKATEVTRNLRDASTEAYNGAVSYVRENPIPAALGLVAFGFVAGALTSWFRRSA